MQSQIYRILSARSGKPLRQIIRDTKRNDFYLDAPKALEYGLVDRILGVTHASTPVPAEVADRPPTATTTTTEVPEAAAELLQPSRSEPTPER
jgi:hypothetical protein